MKKTRILLALMLSIVLITSIMTACGNKPANKTADTDKGGTQRSVSTGKNDNSLTLAIKDQITSIDPEQHTRASEDAVCMQIYDPLFLVDNDGNIKNMLLESYTKNEDGSVDFVLKSNVKFHSGDTLKSEDVEYSLKRCENSTLCSALFGTIDMTITDDTHFKWTFPAADQGAGFDELKDYVQSMGIVNKSFCEGLLSKPTDNLNVKSDGTGAYVLKEQAPNGDITLTRFADYYGVASIDSLYYKYLTGSEEMAFESGSIDMAVYGATNYERIKTYSNVNANSQVLNSLTFLICNSTKDSKLADIRVREAVARCLNRDDITSIGSNDSGTTAYNLANPLITYYADNANHFETDIEKANSLMTEAGYSKSNKLPIKLIVMSSYPDHVAACEAMKEELEQSYFTVTINQVDDTTPYFTYGFDLGMISLSLTTQFNSYSALFDTATGLNLSGIEDKGILDAFSGIKDEATTQNAMKLSTESLAYIPLFYNTTFFAFDSDLNPGPFYMSVTGFRYCDFSWKK